MRATTVLAGVLVTAAVVLAAPPSGPAGRRVRAGTARSRRGAPVPAWLRRPGRRAVRDPGAALGAAVTAVAAEVRAGRAPPDAWRAVLGVVAGPDGVPRAADLAAAVSGARGARTPTAALLRQRVAGVVAATRLATSLGAPLAGVLEECGRALAADAEAETAVRAALAGPRQTTTLLTWLPVLGVVLGTLLGADPLGTLLDSGAGSAAGVGGVVLTVVGRRWVGRMVAAARDAGTGGVAGRDAGAGVGRDGGTGVGRDGGTGVGRNAGAVGGGRGDRG